MNRFTYTHNINEGHVQDHFTGEKITIFHHDRIRGDYPYDAKINETGINKLIEIMNRINKKNMEEII